MIPGERWVESHLAPPADPRRRQRLVTAAITLVAAPLVLMLAGVLAWAVFFRPAGLTVVPRDYTVWPLVLLCALPSLGAMAWLARFIGSGFIFGVLPIGLFGWIALSLFPVMADQINHRDGAAPTLRRTLQLGVETHRSRTRHGYSSSQTTTLAAWADPAGATLDYPGRIDGSAGQVVCVDERPGRLGRRWISNPRPCEAAPDSEIAGLRVTALTPVHGPADAEPLPAYAVSADVPLAAQPFTPSAWFGADGQPRWLLPRAMGREWARMGIFRPGEREPVCGLRLAAQSSDEATAWNLPSDRDPMLELLMPTSRAAPRVLDRQLRVLGRGDCRPQAEWRADKDTWILDADVDAAQERIALLLVRAWPEVAARGRGGRRELFDWLSANARFELRRWNGELLLSEPLVLDQPFHARLQLAGDALYLHALRSVRMLAKPIADHPAAPWETAPAHMRLLPGHGWYSRRPREHWQATAQGLRRSVLFPSPADVQTPPRWRWPLPMSGGHWQVMAVSRGSGSVLASHSALPLSFLLDVAGGRWQILRHDLRSARLTPSDDGRAIAWCTLASRTRDGGECGLLRRADGAAFFTP